MPYPPPSHSSFSLSLSHSPLSLFLLNATDKGHFAKQGLYSGHYSLVTDLLESWDSFSAWHVRGEDKGLYTQMPVILVPGLETCVSIQLCLLSSGAVLGY